MKGAYILLFIAAVIVGGFGGWAYAYASGKGNEGQSTATGYGCGVGAAIGLVTCGALALVSVNSGEEGKHDE